MAMATSLPDAQPVETAGGECRAIALYRDESVARALNRVLAKETAATAFLPESARPNSAGKTAGSGPVRCDPRRGDVAGLGDLALACERARFRRCGPQPARCLHLGGVPGGRHRPRRHPRIRSLAAPGPAGAAANGPGRGGIPRIEDAPGLDAPVVETLIEDGFQNEKAAREYLELIAGENCASAG